MALNLWKIGGQPTSYNPLTSGYPNVKVNPSNYVLSFYASSKSSKRLWILGQSAMDYDNKINLTPTRTFYSLNIKIINAPSIQINDIDSAGDIIIDSFTLVQKPLPKLTINGVDGFLSGKWVNGGGGNNTCNYVVNSDNSLTIQSRDGLWKGFTLDIPILPNTKYNFSGTYLSSINSGLNLRIDSLDNNKSFLSTLINGGYTISGFQNGISFTSTSNGSYARIFLQTPNIEDLTFSNLMFNLGSTPAPFSKKTGDKMVMPYLNAKGKYQINKIPQRVNSSSKGLSFNGVTDYLQLPSMTMDAIELDVMFQTANYVLDARTGLNNGYFALIGAGLGSGWSQLLLNGSPSTFSSVPLNQRVKLKTIATSSFTDDVTILANSSAAAQSKAVLYKVTCYLNGSIVAQYDFTNPKNIVGTTVLQNAQNLIPSFEDSQWTIHANAKVMGKDALHLDSTANSQWSKIKIPVIPNTNYFVKANSTGGITQIYNGNETAFIVNVFGSVTFNSGSNTVVTFRWSNSTTTIGSFDFYKPQFYQLSGQEGTINGAPVALNKPTKRTLYAKR